MCGKIRYRLGMRREGVLSHEFCLGIRDVTMICKILDQ